MKTIKTLLVSLVLLLSTSCGIGDKLDRITDAIEDVSNSAVSLLEKINDISRLVDSKLESGEISQDLADLIDGRITLIAELLESTMQNTGGYFFDRIDGSVNNAFMNLSNLLDQIQTGILEKAIPAIIDQISSQIQMQLSAIAGSIEDIVVLTSGQVMIVVDKTTNGIVIIFSVILLAIALIVFAIILLRRGRRMTSANYIGLGFAGVFLVFFLVLILSPKVRGNIITGFDFASKVETKTLVPKVSGVAPETIVIGKTKRVFIYGTHLNKLEKISVKLTRGDAEKFVFPKSTIIVATSNRIVLGNLDKELSWHVPLYPIFRSYLTESNAQSYITEKQSVDANDIINHSLFENIKPMKTVSRQPLARSAMVPARRSTAAVANRRINFADQKLKNLNLVKSNLGQESAIKYMTLLSKFFFQRYKIEEGDYGLLVYADTARIESTQFLSVLYPPPPVPKPDIFVTDLNWAGGVQPAAGQSSSLDVTFGFSHPEQITQAFSAKITSVPVLTPIEITVPEGKIAAAASGNQVTVTSRVFSVTQPGNYNFTVSVDEQNAIAEKDETNNTSGKELAVGEYKYDIRITSLTFEPIGNATAEINCAVLAEATGLPNQSCTKVIYPQGNISTPVDCMFTFEGMKKGQLVGLSFSASATIKFFFSELRIDLGNLYFPFNLDERPTDGLPSKDYPILRQAKSYTLHGVLNVTQRK